jgi:hypothetical protein
VGCGFFTAEASSTALLGASDDRRVQIFSHRQYARKSSPCTATGGTDHFRFQMPTAARVRILKLETRARTNACEEQTP